MGDRFGVYKRNGAYVHGPYPSPDGEKTYQGIPFRYEESARRFAAGLSLVAGVRVVLTMVDVDPDDVELVYE
jgi:hypothetical protein